jgi:hypothetical protein
MAYRLESQVLKAALVLIAAAVISVSAAQQPSGRATAAASRPTGFLFDDLYLRHNAGNTGHPERPERLTAVLSGLDKAGLAKDLVRVPARPATDDELALVHDRAYIELVKRELANVTGVRTLSTGDTDVTRESLPAA